MCRKRETDDSKKYFRLRFYILQFSLSYTINQSIERIAFDLFVNNKQYLTATWITIESSWRLRFPWWAFQFTAVAVRLKVLKLSLSAILWCFLTSLACDLAGSSCSANGHVLISHCSVWNAIPLPIFVYQQLDAGYWKWCCSESWLIKVQWLGCIHRL